MSTDFEESPLLRELADFVSLGVYDPLGVGITLSDFDPGDAWHHEHYPEEHLLQAFAHWMICLWVDLRLDARDEDASARRDLDELASVLGVFGLDEEDEYEDEALFRFEFIGEIADAAAQPISDVLILDSKLSAEFNRMMVERMNRPDLRNVNIRPAPALDENSPYNVPEWAIQCIHERERKRCARCRRNLGEGGSLDYRIGLAAGGVRDVANLELVCDRCIGRRKYEAPAGR